MPQPPRIRTGPGRRQPLAAMLLIVLALGGCDPGSELRRLVPDLDPIVADLLARERRDDLSAHFRERGTSDLNRSFAVLHREAVFGDEHRYAALLPHLDTLAGIMADEFASELGHYQAASLRRVDRRVLRRAWDENRRRDEIFADASVPDREKVELLHRMGELFADHDLLWYTVALEETVAQVHAGLGQRDLMREHLQAALRASRAVDYAGMTCQILGAMAEIFWEEGQVDSARVYVDHLQARAERSRLALQAARAETFRCSFSLAEGRLHAAHLHLKEARRLCREYRGGQHEAIYIAILSRFYANLGCWRIVEQLLEQADTLLGNEPPDFLAPTVVDLELLRAEALLQRGRGAEAHGRTAAVLAAANPRPHRLRYGRIAWHRSRLLLADGQPGEALPVIREGLERSREDNLPGMGRAFTLQLALALEQQGRVVEAQAELDRFRAGETDLLPGDLEAAALLDIELAWTSHGDSRALVEAVARAFRALQGRLAERDPSAHTYLDLQGFDGLRMRVHRFIADDARLGLDFELAWRSLARLRTSGDAWRQIGAPFPEPMPQDITTWVRRWSARVNQTSGGDRMVGSDATLLLFAVVDDDVFRWQVDPDGLRRERLALGPDRLRSLVARALDRMATPPDGSWQGTGPLADDLARLARELVPGDLRRRWLARRTDERPGTVLIAADDALTRIPFEALDLDLGPGYLPLDDAVVVTYLRYFATSQARDPAGPLVVVADPEPAPALVRRYPELSALPGARHEAARVGLAWRSPPVLSGREATKAALTGRWTGASGLYLATHVVRDPATPYLSFVPLSPAAPTDLDAAILETRDILGADLGSCRLVVLSGCSSGSPYVEGSRVAPGLADAFLDAGCRTTVQTFWRVGDETAMQLMGTFADRSGPTAGSPRHLARALREARASVRRAGSATAHPFHWAAHHVVTTDPGSD